MAFFPKEPPIIGGKGMSYHLLKAPASNSTTITSTCNTCYSIVCYRRNEFPIPFLNQQLKPVTTATAVTAVTCDCNTAPGGGVAGESGREWMKVAEVKGAG
jgi:hypothetical protein